MLGVAGVALLLASPAGPFIAGYAGVTYLAATMGGAVAGAHFGSGVASRVLGEK